MIDSRQFPFYPSLSRKTQIQPLDFDRYGPDPDPRREEEEESPVVIDEQYSGGESDSDSEEADSKKSESKAASVAAASHGEFGNSTTKRVSPLLLVFRGMSVAAASVWDIYLPGLIIVLAEFLPASKIETLCKSVGDFRENKMTRGELAGSVRRIVGDDSAFIAAINSYRNCKEKQQQQPAK